MKKKQVSKGIRKGHLGCSKDLGKNFAGVEKKKKRSTGSVERKGPEER